MSGRIAVVTEDNRFLRWSHRAAIHEHRLLHRSVHVIIHDRAGRLVLQRRHPSKDNNPDRWDISVSGHVEEDDYLGGPDERLDEVYAAVARRETLEELGVETELTYVRRLYPVADVHYELIALFRGVHDGPYVPQPEEITAVRAVTPAEMTRMLAEEPLTSGLRWFAELGLLF